LCWLDVRRAVPLPEPGLRPGRGGAVRAGRLGCCTASTRLWPSRFPAAAAAWPCSPATPGPVRRSGRGPGPGCPTTSGRRSRGCRTRRKEQAPAIRPGKPGSMITVDFAPPALFSGKPSGPCP